MRKSSQRGAITLEACVSVLSFLVLMLILSSLFVMFMAQNVTAHVTLQAAESLSLDAYRIEKLMKEDGKIGTVSGNLAQMVAKVTGSSSDNPYYVTDDRWYNGDSAQISQVVKTRFVGYLTGGDEIKADEKLKSLNVVGGLSGLDFSESYVSDYTLYIVLKYKLEYDFNIWGLGTVAVEQRTCSKLWK